MLREHEMRKGEKRQSCPIENNAPVYPPRVTRRAVVGEPETMSGGVRASRVPTLVRRGRVYSRGAPGFAGNTRCDRIAPARDSSIAETHPFNNCRLGGPTRLLWPLALTWKVRRTPSLAERHESVIQSSLQMFQRCPIPKVGSSSHPDMRNMHALTLRGSGRPRWWIYYLPPRRTGFIPGGAALLLSHVRIVLDNAVGRRVSSGISRFSRPCVPALLRTHLASPSSALKTSISYRQTRGAARHFSTSAQQPGKITYWMYPVSLAALLETASGITLRWRLSNIGITNGDVVYSRCDNGCQLYEQLQSRAAGNLLTWKTNLQMLTTSDLGSSSESRRCNRALENSAPMDCTKIEPTSHTRMIKRCRVAALRLTVCRRVQRSPLTQAAQPAHSKPDTSSAALEVTDARRRDDGNSCFRSSRALKKFPPNSAIFITLLVYLEAANRSAAEKIRRSELLAKTVHFERETTAIGTRSKASGILKIAHASRLAACSRVRLRSANLGRRDLYSVTTTWFGDRAACQQERGEMSVRGIRTRRMSATPGGNKTAGLRSRALQGRVVQGKGNNSYPEIEDKYPRRYFSLFGEGSSTPNTDAISGLPSLWTVR
ncbi:hypothetical protein PR048_032881 [Dryococelus australis]|uniref:Uncharacterized protein n=1 Tax=Dryococelus australis TaxID=614101 RepID=A0ABQ9G3H2_9NEOP|nr:hypothetical protein PR048_032881 [Dryococelus australis]